MTTSNEPHTTATEPLMKFKSHVDGKNADVEILTDRIEWSKSGMLMGKRASEMMPIKSISSVNTKKDGFVFWKVVVITVGNTIEFRVDVKTAEQAKALLTQLVLGAHPSQVVPTSTHTAPSPASAGNVADELTKLAALRDSGVLDAAEFAEQKARVLAAH